LKLWCFCKIEIRLLCPIWTWYGKGWVWSNVDFYTIRNLVYLMWKNCYEICTHG